MEKTDLQNELILAKTDYAELISYATDLKLALEKLQEDAGDFVQDRKKAENDVKALQALKTHLTSVEVEREQLKASLEAQETTNLT